MICLALMVSVAIILEAESGSPGGAVYTRWGRKDCPESAELIYSGYAGGTWYEHPGGAVEPLCLPKDPQWRHTDSGLDEHRGYVYGAEYYIRNRGIFSHMRGHDVPCAVCETVSRSSVVVIPARTQCYDGWKKEYGGYLMSGYHGHRAASTYSCIDKDPQYRNGGTQTHFGKLFYPVEARCGSLKCPPYNDGWELTCVVCSRE